MEKNDIQYDLLLEGKKIPKGHWGSLTTCNFADYEKIEQEIKEKSKKQEDLVLKKKRMDAKYLCHEPYGQLNDCLWVKSQNECIRKRCDAQGRWADPQTIKAQMSFECSSEATVKKCDY